MFKNLIVLILLSIGIVLGISFAHSGLELIVNAHDWIAEALKQVFSVGETGNLIRKLIALIAIPIIVGLIAALLHWAVRRNWTPYFMYFVWVTWLIQTAALIMQYKP